MKIFHHEYVAHIEYDLILARISSDRPFDGEFRLSRVEDTDCFLRFQSLYDTLIMDGQFEDGICHLITDFATDTLLDLHPPRIFQIDGNLGGTAAVIEMLLQSYHGELHFLPALPKAWQSGKVSGLRARGNITVDMEWREGNMVCASLEAAVSRECTIIHAPERCRIVDSAERDVGLRREGHRVLFAMKEGERYQLLAL